MTAVYFTGFRPLFPAFLAALALPRRLIATLSTMILLVPVADCLSPSLSGSYVKELLFAMYRDSASRNYTSFAEVRLDDLTYREDRRRIVLLMRPLNTEAENKKLLRVHFTEDRRFVKLLRILRIAGTRRIIGNELKDPNEP